MDKTSYTPTTLGYAILGLLSQNDLSGYEIRKVFEASPMGHYSSSPGSIYPAMKRLEKANIVSKVALTTASDVTKKKFRLTSHGRHVFKTWLEAPVSKDDVINNTDGLILRFAFMTSEISIEHRAAFLENFQQELASYLKYLKTYRNSVSGLMNIHSLLALDRGIENCKADIKWAKSALETITKESSTVRQE